MKKQERLKIYEELQQILSDVAKIPPQNHANMARKALSAFSHRRGDSSVLGTVGDFNMV